MIKYFLKLTLVLFSVNQLAAQPHITGELSVDIEKGYFHCDFTLSNLPHIGGYRILLNRGMNIKTIQDENKSLLNYDGFYDGEMNGEAIEYILNTNKREELPMPKSFSIEYVGAFPVYKDSYNSFDFKGFIAVNDQTLRATEQTKWYPVIYDVDNDKKINAYTYDLTIKISGGITIFINGSAPKKTDQDRFVSKKPYPLLLFLGNYDFIDYNENYILNDSLSNEDAALVFKNIEDIKKVLVEILDQKFEDKIFLIKHKAVNKRREGSSWGFNTYPSFAFTGIKFNELVKEEDKFSDNMLRYFGHEFSHNYFGNNVLSGTYMWFWLESLPEYLSFRIAEELVGPAYLKEVLQQKIKRVEKDSFVVFGEIEEKKAINDQYRYNLAPLLLKCFESEFGKDKMDLLMKGLLERSHSETLTLASFKEIALEVGVREKELLAFENTYIKHENFKDNIISRIRKIVD